MRVLLVSGPAVGGIRVHLWQLLALLPPFGVEPLIAGPESVSGPPGVRRVDLTIGETLHPLRDLKQVSDLTAIRNAWRADVVHAHGYKAAMIASVAGPKPLVVTFHNLWPTNAGALARLGLRWTLRESCRQVAVSRAVLDSVEAVTGPLPGGLVIPNAIEWKAFASLPSRTESRQALGIEADAFVVGFAGRLTPVKGAQVLLEAARTLVPCIPGLIVLMAGEGPERAELEQQASDLGNHIRWMGAVPDIRLLFAAADAWCVPSLAEGGGIVALEAMAAGLPVVASAVGGLVEIIDPGQTGILTPAGDASATAEALRRFAKDPEFRQQLGTQAAEAARRRSGPEESVRQLVDVYREAIGRGPAT